MPKDSVEIINDDVFVNGNKIYEPYVFLQKSRNLNNKRWVLDSDEYFVIEDNRDSDNYSSSKYTGPINKKSITGVVFFKLFPIERIGSI